MTLPVRSELAGLTAYGAPQLDVAVRLNTNENPYPPSAELVGDLAAALAEAAVELRRYPDREATQLRAGLAAYLDQPVEGVWAANGSNEVLQQLCLAFGGAGRSALGFEPSYSMHRLIALTTGTRWVSASRAADFSLSAADAVAAVEEHQPDLVFLCTPNNPTGNSLAPDVVAAVAEAAPGMVVVDEAYAEFSSSPSSLSLLRTHPRLVVTRTMSKAFGLAGNRIGYLAASPEVVDAMRVVRLPYHLSALAQAAASVALRHTHELLGTVATVIEERERVAHTLGLVEGVEVLPSDANFLLFGRFPDASKTWQALLDRGVLVRDVSGGHGLAGWLRVTIGLPEENDAFLAALREVIEGEQ